LGTVPGIEFVCDEVQRYRSLVPHVKSLRECKKTDFHFRNAKFTTHGNQFKMLVFHSLNKKSIIFKTLKGIISHIILRLNLG
jgi:hypothetical protein